MHTGPGRQRGQISGSLQGGGTGYLGCHKDGGLQVTAGWRSPDRGRMEVSMSPQDGGLQVAAGWRSPGRRWMEVSRSPQDGALQVAAKWRFPGIRRMEVSRSPQVCRSLWEGGGFCSRKVTVVKSMLGRGFPRVDIFRLPRCEGLMSPKGGDLQVVKRWRSSDRNMVEVSRTQQDEGLEVATKRGAQVAIGRRHSSHQRMDIFKSPQDGDRRYLSSNPKPRQGTRCSAYAPSLGFRVGRRMSGIET